MSGRGGDAYPVKVVIINTQHIETDAASFKSVVQKLTGKDSTVAVSPKSADNLFHRSSEGGGQRAIPERSRFETVQRTNASLCRDESFNRLMKEMPSVDDELHQLWLWAQS
ncbi:VQ motif-containing protein 10-like [Rhodamnia argentea]|uniref:VQ motif-containing protein 10-like n=1 Tax=Rhodamnia argentea TaxID=178133 RepID=A0A8B8QYJ7_9MYRT|nr:VQ motif-containing protein 10-like [Rhodamnia argentea]